MREFYNRDGSKPNAIGKIPIENIQAMEFNRFNFGCENCGQKDYYLLHKKRVLPNLSKENGYVDARYSLFSSETRYYISCPNCSYVLELEYKEYKNVKKYKEKLR